MILFFMIIMGNSEKYIYINKYIEICGDMQICMASWDNYVILSRWENLSSLSSLAPRFLIGNAHRSEPSEPLTFLRMIDGVIFRNNII